MIDAKSLDTNKYLQAFRINGRILEMLLDYDDPEDMMNTTIDQKTMEIVITVRINVEKDESY